LPGADGQLRLTGFAVGASSESSKGNKRTRKRSARTTAGRPAVSRFRTVTTFSEYQQIVEKTDEKKQRIISLLGLVGEVGDLHSMIKKLMLQKDNPTFRADLTEEFGDILWYVTSLAALYKISLRATKAESLYTEGPKTAFDERFPEDEQLPRNFRVTFFEKPLEHGIYVKITVNGVVIGDALTDNAHEDDGYRYHDAFHLAYAAVLGWSPVTRSLLRRKRKSKPKIDEVEDGARAVIVEEAISIFIFNQARDRGWYKDESSIDIGLLKTIRRFTSGLEVRVCTAKQWRKAILSGFSVFDKLRAANGGTVELDLDKQSISFVEAGEH
jgi:NTP pyrophosphatase (non-canonical NTP hydrolase)